MKTATLAATVVFALLGCRSDVVLGNRTTVTADGSVDGAVGVDGGTDAGTDSGTDSGRPACGDPCPAAECGPAPLFDRLCQDGIARSSASDRCLRAADGTCQWEIVTCIEERICPNVDDCGPAPGAPAYMCADGSFAGNVGSCLQGETACGWYFRDCPPQECASADCGPVPGQPNVQCPDGVNTSGPTGRCVRPTGAPSCEWEIATCPWVEPFCG